jgi:hypothetical protein
LTWIGSKGKYGTPHGAQLALQGLLNVGEVLGLNLLEMLQLLERPDGRFWLTQGEARWWLAQQEQPTWEAMQD